MRLLLMLSCLLVVGIYAQTVEEIRKIGLPVVIVETVNREEPTCETSQRPPGCMGDGIINATKVPGKVLIIQHQDTLFDSQEYEKDIKGMTIKLRGNSSAYFYAKKPFKIKLQKKADLLLRSDKKYEDKDWLLLALPAKNLRTVLGFKVNELLDVSWTPSYKFVNLFFNDDYRGVYLLCESVKRNVDCRLNVSSTGYIFERDVYFYNEDVYVPGSLAKWYGYTFKYPDSDDITTDQLQYIQTLTNALESSINQNNYDDYIDVESAAKWVMGHDILGTHDCYGSNLFLCKYDDTELSKITLGPLWDFDSIFRTPDTFSLIHDDPQSYFTYMFNNTNKSFTKAYIKQWSRIVDNGVFDKLISFIEGFSEQSIMEALNLSRGHDSKRWGEELDDVQILINNTVDWLVNRRIWMSDTINKMCENETTSISQQNIEINSDKLSQKSSDVTFCTIDGRRTTSPKRSKGIVIQVLPNKKSKKIVIK